MTILVAAGPGSTAWADLLRTSRADQGLEIDVVTMRDPFEPDDVEYVLTWSMPPAELARFHNLRGVLVTGAGFDHLEIGAMPKVPIVRLVDPAMAMDIALYVLSWVISYQRDFDRFAQAQQSSTWRNDLPVRFPRDVTVGVLGAGAIGAVVLDTCAAHGFTTVGWSRSHHDRSLPEFFEACDIVVNLVPLSEATRHLVGVAELEALGDGVLINVGRGGTVDIEALLVALDRDLRGAVLDVFDDEPLDAESALWGHRSVVVTPHVAGRSDPVTAAPIVLASIVSLIAGDLPDATVPRG